MLSRNLPNKKGLRQANNYEQSNDRHTSDLNVIKLTFQPNNVHLWKPKLIHALKSKYPPIHDCVIAGEYPDIDSEIQVLTMLRPSDVLAPEGAVLADRRLSAIMQRGSQRASIVPEFRRADTPEDMAFQRDLAKTVIGGKIRTLQQLQYYLVTELPKGYAMVIDSLSSSVKTKIERHSEFENIDDRSDVIELIKIAEHLANLTPDATADIAEDLRVQRRAVRQGHNEIVKYCKEFDRFEKELVKLDRATREDELITLFTRGLHPSYCQPLTQMKIAGTMPTELSEVQKRMEEIESMALHQARSMSSADHHSRSNQRTVMDVAMVQNGSRTQQTRKLSGSDNRRSNAAPPLPRTGTEQRPSPVFAAVTRNRAANAPRGQQPSRPSGRQDLTPEQARAKGLRMLPCCNKWGVHPPHLCRNPVNARDRNGGNRHLLAMTDEPDDILLMCMVEDVEIPDYPYLPSDPESLSVDDWDCFNQYLVELYSLSEDFDSAPSDLQNRLDEYVRNANPSYDWIAPLAVRRDAWFAAFKLDDVSIVSFDDEDDYTVVEMQLAHCGVVDRCDQFLPADGTFSILDILAPRRHRATRTEQDEESWNHSDSDIEYWNSFCNRLTIPLPIDQHGLGNNPFAPLSDLFDSDDTEEIPIPAVVAEQPVLDLFLGSYSNASRDLVYLDTGASCNIAPLDSPLVRDIESIDPRVVQGISAQTATSAGFLLSFGFCLLVPGVTVHVVSFSFLIEVLGMTASFNNDSHVWILTLGPNTYQFTRRSNGLYAYSPQAENIQSNPHETDSSDEFVGLQLDHRVDGSVYTQAQRQRAEQARELHHRVGHPSDAYMKFALSNGVFLNCGLTASDVELANAMLGPCPSCIQAKAVHEPHPPSTHARATTVGGLIAIDLAFVDMRPFLVLVDQFSDCILTYDLKGRKNHESVKMGLTNLLAKLQSYGHKINLVLVDPESVLLSLATYLATHEIQLQSVGAGRHVAIVERAIRSIKAKARAILFSLPYRLPARLRGHLFLESAQCCNLLPAAATGSRSPREIVTGTKLTINRALNSQFGDLVLAKTPSTATKPPAYTARSEYGIVVSRNIASDHVNVFLLATQEIVCRHTFSPAPWTDALIDVVNAMTTTPSDANSDDSFADGNESVSPSDAIADTATPFPGVLTQEGIPPLIGIPAPSSADPVDDSVAARGDDPFLPSESDAASSIVEPFNDDDESAPTEPASADPTEPPIPEETTVIEPRYPARANRTTWRDHAMTFLPVMVLQLTVQTALERFGDSASASMREELSQLITQDVLRPVDKRTLSVHQIKAIIPCRMFLKEKLRPDGSFDKLKSRLVAGGHRQDHSLYPDVSSPCVNLSSFFTIVAIAAYRAMRLSAIDIKGAYLNARLKSVQVHMKIPASLVPLLIDIYKKDFNTDVAKYVERDGSLTVEVLKALYGLVESSLLWYEHLVGTLVSAGYIISSVDRGVFVRRSGDDLSIICVHVDDILHAATNVKLEKELNDLLRRVYRDINVQLNSAQLFYLGMQLDVNASQRSITISQPGFVTELFDAYPTAKTAVSPATEYLFNVSENGTAISAKDFASKLMKIAFLAKRSRPDLCLAVSFLATRMQKPNNFDMQKLDRLYEYVNGTRNLALTVKPSSLEIHAWIDASYAVHSDMRSHTGIIIGLGDRGAPVYFRSSIQKLTADSSTYAELIALHEGVRHIQWLQQLLKDLHQSPMKICTVYQDNKSTIQLANKGPGSVARSRHFDIRYFYVKECIDKKLVVLQYLQTADMVADFLTKPNQGQLLRERVSWILNLGRSI